MDLSDLEELDPDLSRNLQWVMDKDDISELELDFTYAQTVFGKELVVDLLPNGKDIPVDNSNKEEYVRLVIELLLVKKV